MPPDRMRCVLAVVAGAEGAVELGRLVVGLAEVPGVAVVVLGGLARVLRSVRVGGRETRPVVDEAAAVDDEHIWVCPQGAEVSGELRALTLRAKEGWSCTVDEGLASLAESLGDHLVVMYLAGARRDGVASASAVSAAGGLILSTPHSGEPRVGQEGRGVADRLVDVADVGRELQSYLQIFDATAGVSEETPMWHAIGRACAEEGVDVKRYRSTRVARCVERRRYLVGGSSLGAYVELLRADRTERVQLRRALLGPVTRFFRDGRVWDGLFAHVLTPRMQALQGEEIRCWVAGCSTGEEPYTLAMLALEAAERTGQRVKVRVHATDVSMEGLDVASAGWYAATACERISPERLERWFVSDRGGFRVGEALREAVIFSRHDVTQDPPLTRMDVVCCRNVLSLLRPASQQRTLAILHKALLDGGALVLGRGETVSTLESAFDRVEPSLGLYRRVATPLTRVAAGRARSTHRRRVAPLLDLDERVFGDDLRRRRGVCLFLSPDGVVLRVLGEPQDLLTVQPGELQPRLGMLLDPRLAVPIAAAVRRCLATGEPVRLHRLPHERSAVDVWVRSHEGAVGEASFLSVVVTQASQTTVPLELSTVRERLGSNIDELRGASVAGAAVGRELLLAREGLAATREQLSEVLAEIRVLEEDMARLDAERAATESTMDAVLISTDLGAVLVDGDLRVRSFSPAAANFLGLGPADVNRPLAEVRHDLQGSLLVDVREAMRSVRATQETVTTRSGWTLSKRVTPVGMGGSHARSVIITLLAVDHETDWNQQLDAAHDRILASVAADQVGLWSWDAEGMQLGPGVEEALGCTWEELPADDRARVLAAVGGMTERASLDLVVPHEAGRSRWRGSLDPVRHRVVGVVTREG